MPLSSYSPTIRPSNIPSFPKELKRTWTFSGRLQLSPIKFASSAPRGKAVPAMCPPPFWRHPGRTRALLKAVGRPFLSQPLGRAWSTSNFHETRNDIPSRAPTSEARGSRRQRRLLPAPSAALGGEKCFYFGSHLGCISPLLKISLGSAELSPFSTRSSHTVRGPFQIHVFPSAVRDFLQGKARQDPPRTPGKGRGSPSMSPPSDPTNTPDLPVSKSHRSSVKQGAWEAGTAAPRSEIPQRRCVPPVEQKRPSRGCRLCTPQPSPHKRAEERTSVQKHAAHTSMQKRA